MYIQVHESMYKYKHVCTMFSSVRTNLPYPVQVVRIPDGHLFLNLRKPNPLFPVATVVCLREGNSACPTLYKIGTLETVDFPAFFCQPPASSTLAVLNVFVIAM